MQILNWRRAARSSTFRRQPAPGIVKRLKAELRTRTVMTMTALCFALPQVGSAADPFTTARNAPRARVVVVQDRDATDAFRPRPENVQVMVDRAVKSLTGKTTPRDAWLSLVSTQDVVGLKVFSAPGQNSGTRPAVAAAVARGLINAGVPPNQIIIWDKSEYDLRAAGFFGLGSELGIRVAGSAQAGYDPTVFYDTPLIGSLIWGDLEFGRTGEGIGRKSFISKLVTREVTRIINVTPLLNHNTAGVSGNLYGLTMGSVDNTMRFESEASRLAGAVPEIYALPALGDRVALNIVDALICQYEGGQRGLLHYSTVLNQLRFSRDPVALDMLSIKELDRQRRAARAPYVKPNLELYRNAALLELGVSDVTRIAVETLK
ncbi:MAG: DUF362 domain-containing protein [Verrucomicrobia bacterium]|nr:DUF362 domain-containing protein [Verrucomicrobiota bacterium]